MHLQSIDAQYTYPIDQPRWRAEDGQLLDLHYLPSFDPESIVSQDFSMWRYREVMPLSLETVPVSMNEGLTPLVKVALGGRSVGMKLDYLFPSGSYKDRGAAMLVSYARQLGVKSVVQDSSGNAGCAVAHYAALAGMDCEIFVPASTSPAKLLQIKAVGAKVTAVPGSREDTAQAAMAAAEERFYASHVWQPWFFHGTKTFIYEVMEQRGWRAPDTLILPGGNGTLLLGVYLGLLELKAAGVISSLPKLIGVQAENCAPLFHAFNQGKSEVALATGQKTVAEGIAIAVPRRAKQMIQYVRDTQGLFLAVSEEEISSALRVMLQQGFYLEPTSAAVVAGVRQYLSQYAEPDEDIVSVITGHGLKAAEKIDRLIS
ncbi:MAG: threonine synthase [Bacteroidota bacterium]